MSTTMTTTQLRCRPGRQKGAKAYSQSDMENLTRIVLALQKTAGFSWEAVAETYNSATLLPRDAASLRKKWWSIRVAAHGMKGRGIPLSVRDAVLENDSSRQQQQHNHHQHHHEQEHEGDVAEEHQRQRQRDCGVEDNDEEQQQQQPSQIMTSPDMQPTSIPIPLDGNPPLPEVSLDEAYTDGFALKLPPLIWGTIDGPAPVPILAMQQSQSQQQQSSEFSPSPAATDAYSAQADEHQIVWSSPPQVYAQLPPPMKKRMIVSPATFGWEVVDDFELNN